ncbi:hypothetical protein [Nereida sp. MMG025]|uniref:hypothetical protein n=1 Tax=Nereida sp. MMG025 TaxID=2909981 RepID=UPI001F3263CF|nr:hypothetical protein [Nereida sp. MMG025]MCF6444023.1 hypothetical protein [Nereida sp. MMG025]
MDRLSLILSLAVGAVITGGFTIIVLSLGYYNWYAIGGAAILGFALSWPSAYLISRRIKRQDPEFDHTRVRDVDVVIPERNAREV